MVSGDLGGSGGGHATDNRTCDHRKCSRTRTHSQLDTRGLLDMQAAISCCYTCQFLSTDFQRDFLDRLTFCGHTHSLATVITWIVFLCANFEQKKYFGHLKFFNNNIKVNELIAIDNFASTYNFG